MWTHVHELTFTFAICYRPSVCLSVVCLSVPLVLPTQPVKIFRNFSSLFGTLVPWPSNDIHGIFYRNRPRGTPPSGDLNARGVSKYSDFHLWNAVSPKRCKIGGKLVLITNRKPYMSFRLVPKVSDLEWPWTAKWPLFCVIFTEFGNFRNVLHKSGWQSHNYGQFTITMSSSKHLQRDRATPTV